MIDHREEMELRDWLADDILRDVANGLSLIGNLAATHKIDAGLTAWNVVDANEFKVVPSIILESNGSRASFPLTPSQAARIATQLLRMSIGLMEARQARATRIELQEIQTLIDVKVARRRLSENEENAA